MRTFLRVAALAAVTGAAIPLSAQRVGEVPRVEPPPTVQPPVALPNTPLSGGLSGTLSGTTGAPRLDPSITTAPGVSTAGSGTPPTEDAADQQRGDAAADEIVDHLVAGLPLIAKLHRYE